MERRSRIREAIAGRIFYGCYWPRIAYARAIENWQELATLLMRRVLRESEALDSLRCDFQKIVDECVPHRGESLLRKVDWPQPTEVILPLRIRAGEIRLALFSTITTLGTPSDITLQELRIEAYQPADRMMGTVSREGRQVFVRFRQRAVPITNAVPDIAPVMLLTKQIARQG